LGLLAEGCLGAGERETGLQAVDEGLTHSRATRASHNDAELQRVHGDLLALDDDDTARRAAEAAYKRAIDTARAQGAKAWELRSALALGKLWHGEGRAAEARALVSEVYEWFEDGSATPDLQDAKALLQALA
jgi:adenylate cyclase